MKRILFDIETAPLPAGKLKGHMPRFSAPSNWKDKDKIEANIKDQERKWASDSALSPMTGRVLSIAVQTVGDPDSLRTFEGEEMDILKKFLKLYMDSVGGAEYKLVGFNVKEFDLPFIVRRCWINSIDVPFSLTPNGDRRFYWPSSIIDAREIWGLTDWRPSGSLDSIGKAFGIGSKTGSGEMFHKLYSNMETRGKAMEYQKSEMLILDLFMQRICPS